MTRFPDCPDGKQFNGLWKEFQRFIKEDVPGGSEFCEEDGELDSMESWSEMWLAFKTGAEYASQ